MTRVDNLIQKVERDRRLSAEVVDAAEALVALWKAQKIAGVSRSERNSAIDETRARLIEAVDALHE